MSGSTESHVVYRRWRLLGFEYRSDLIAHDYMRRWSLKTPWGTLRLHHILRSDNDREFHDHPMDFTSLILVGGYVEHRPGGESRLFMPGAVVRRRAEDLHRLELVGESAWTVLATSPYRRAWGFATEDGWVAAEHYDAWRASKNPCRPIDIDIDGGVDDGVDDGGGSVS